jgi:cyclopropane fatty-acyl-phospholipid synthase-like methyltransferase
MLNKIRGSLRRFICPFDEVLAQIPKGCALFDLGCGTGSFLEIAAAKRRCRRLGGSEVRQDLLRHARQRLLTLGFPAADTMLELVGDSPPLLTEFEIVTMIDVLHHIPRAAHSAYFRDLYKRMPKDSRFVFKDIDGNSPLKVFNQLHDLVFSGNGFQEISMDEACSHLESAGFHIQHTRRIRRLWYPHYMIVAIKP